MAVVACGLLSSAPQARADNDAANLVTRAKITLDDLRHDKEFGNARDLLHRARGVLIVPELVKGGFFLGGEGGSGVLLARSPDLSWSEPAFYTLASASFGLQIGLQQSELVLIILSDKALHAFMSDEFKIGAQAGLAIVTLGSMAEADTTSHFNADIVVWASSTGAYAGLTLNGSLIKPRDSYNEAYYGAPQTANTIIYKRTAPHVPASDALQQAIANVS
jgi:lipid-binding SYLF domain-containing protein